MTGLDHQPTAPTGGRVTSVGEAPDGVGSAHIIGTAAQPAPVATPLLVARGVSLSYALGRSAWPWARPVRFRAVDGVSLTLSRGETLGIVGESGCGKSSLSRLLLGLSQPEAGSIVFDGRPMPDPETKAWRALRTRIQMVFQDTAGSLDPRLPVWQQVREPLMIHRIHGAQARTEQVLEAVRLGRHLWGSLPRELSGGQMQRVIIARALALAPDLMVLDEPVSALDVSIQAQIVNLLVELQASFGLGYVFVSHDLGVVRHIAHRVGVMYLGRLVEIGPKQAVFDSPRHPYTRALLAAVPIPDPAKRARRIVLQGDPPSPHRPPSGCRFHPRCPFSSPVCSVEAPQLRPLGASEVACHHAEEMTDTAPALPHARAR